MTSRPRTTHFTRREMLLASAAAGASMVAGITGCSILVNNAGLMLLGPIVGASSQRAGFSIDLGVQFDAA